MSQAIIKDAETRMKKTIDTLQQDFAKVRTGRADPRLLDTVTVSYYGSDVPLSQVANVAISDSRTITVTPWEKGIMPAIEKGIIQANLGFNPVNVGDNIRVPLPPLTEERRKELIKVIKHEGETAKVAIRNIRRDANNQFKELLKAKTISEDEERRSQETIQKMTDKYIADIDKHIVVKEKDLLSI